MKRVALGILFLAVSILSFTTTHAAVVDCFLKFGAGPSGPIMGESTDPQHKDQIEVLGWSIAESQGTTVSSTTAQRVGGRVQMQEFRFTARMSMASPILFKVGASGEHIQRAELACRKTGMNQPDYLRIRLDDLIVSSYHTGVLAPSAAPVPSPGIPPASSGDGIPLDQVGLTFAKITIEYRGPVGGAIVGSYDGKTNIAK